MAPEPGTHPDCRLMHLSEAVSWLFLREAGLVESLMRQDCDCWDPLTGGCIYRSLTMSVHCIHQGKLLMTKLQFYSELEQIHILHD
jgi:hypothetical protein